MAAEVGEAAPSVDVDDSEESKLVEDGSHGVVDVHISGKYLAKCYLCSLDIERQCTRVTYCWKASKPHRYIHTDCVHLIPDSQLAKSIGSCEESLIKNVQYVLGQCETEGLKSDIEDLLVMLRGRLGSI